MISKHKQEVKSAVTLAMIVGTFIVLWMPGITCLLFISVTGSQDSRGVLEITAMFVHANAAIDPLIYAYRMRNIRVALKRVFNFEGKTTDRAQSLSSSRIKERSKSLSSFEMSTKF